MIDFTLMFNLLDFEAWRLDLKQEVWVNYPSQKVSEL